MAQRGPDRYSILPLTQPGFPIHIEEKWQSHSDPHTHDAFEFFFVVSGTAQHLFEGTSQRISPGDLVFLDLEKRHGFPDVAPNKLRIINCLFLPEVFGAHASARGMASVLSNFQPGNASISLKDAARKTVDQILRDMLEEYRNKPFGYQRAIVGLLEYFFALTDRYRIARMARKDAPAREGVEAVYRVCQYVDAHFAKNISFKNLAKSEEMNYSYLSALFHRVAGRTFREYLLQKRLESAKLLLRTSKHAIISICYDCGFGDPANFARHFKRYTGVTPGKYRRWYELPRD